MMRLSSFFAAAVIIAAVAYGVTYHINSRNSEDQWIWLRREFHLTDGQFARVKVLQDAYTPVCADHCRRIMDAQARLSTLSAGSPEQAAALKEWEAIKTECNAASLQQLNKIAAEMSSPQGRRYLDLMVPRIARHDHHEPRGVK